MRPAITIIEIAGCFIPLAFGNMKIKDEFYYVLNLFIQFNHCRIQPQQANANMLHSMIIVKKLEVADTARDGMTGKDGGPPINR